jgi:hypothetical protein
VPKYGERPTTAYWQREHEQQRAQHLVHGILHTSTMPAMQEDETECLHRVGIVADAEYQETQERE